MLNEKVNNISAWKDKLEDAKLLPSEALQDKNAAWEKLYHRLDTKSKSKKVGWYWLAAACLLVIIFIPSIFHRQKNIVAINKTQQTKKELSSSSSAKKIIPANNFASVINEKMNKSNHSGKENNKHSTSIYPVNLVSTLVIVKTQDIVIPIVIDSPAVHANAIAVNIIPAAKTAKKLKVVHINELGEPVIESPDLAKYYQHNSLQLKFIYREAYANSLPSNNTGIDIFKTRISPSN